MFLTTIDPYKTQRSITSMNPHQAPLLTKPTDSHSLDTLHQYPTSSIRSMYHKILSLQKDCINLSYNTHKNLNELEVQRDI
jgi:hypothetical protein